MPVNYILDFKLGRVTKSLLEKVTEKGKRDMLDLQYALRPCTMGILLMFASSPYSYVGLASRDEIAEAFDQYEVWCRDRLFPAKRKVVRPEDENESACHIGVDSFHSADLLSLQWRGNPKSRCTARPVGKVRAIPRLGYQRCLRAPYQCRLDHRSQRTRRQAKQQ